MFHLPQLLRSRAPECGAGDAGSSDKPGTSHEVSTLEGRVQILDLVRKAKNSASVAVRMLGKNESSIQCHVF